MRKAAYPSTKFETKTGFAKPEEGDATDAKDTGSA
jgi:hypothetical protein